MVAYKCRVLAGIGCLQCARLISEEDAPRDGLTEPRLREGQQLTQPSHVVVEVGCANLRRQDKLNLFFTKKRGRRTHSNFVVHIIRRVLGAGDDKTQMVEGQGEGVVGCRLLVGRVDTEGEGRQGAGDVNPSGILRSVRPLRRTHQRQTGQLQEAIGGTRSLQDPSSSSKLQDKPAVGRRIELCYSERRGGR